MSNPQKTKGDAAERAVVAWFRDFKGFAAERIRSGRSTDPGDITWPMCDYLIDVKNRDRWRVQAWFREVADEAEVESSGGMAPNLIPCVIVKVPGETDPGRWLAVMRVEDVEWGE